MNRLVMIIAVSLTGASEVSAQCAGGVCYGPSMSYPSMSYPSMSYPSMSYPSMSYPYPIARSYPVIESYVPYAPTVMPQVTQPAPARPREVSPWVMRSDGKSAVYQRGRSPRRADQSCGCGCPDCRCGPDCQCWRRR